MITTSSPPPCPQCGSKKYRIVAQEEFNGDTLGIQKCTDCGLHIVWPRLEGHNEAYKLFTEESFFKKYGAIARGEKLHDRHNNYLEEVALVKRYSGEKSLVLDVGCNAGWLLGYLKNAGLQIEGVEPSAVLAKIAANRTNAVIHNSYLHEILNRDAVFDCITATDVIEHVPPENINQFIVSIQKLLKVGGIVIIKTPNVRFTYFKHLITSRIPKAIRKHLLKSLEVWDAKEHVIQWDAHALAVMFKKHGLEPVAVFVPRPVETANSPFIPKLLRKMIFQLSKFIQNNQSIPWFAQDICLVARRRA